MFNIGPQELLLILVLALVVVGPRRLPEIARSVGKGVRELRKAQDEVRKTIQVSLDDDVPTDRPRRPRRLPVADETGSPAPAADGPSEPAATVDEAPSASGTDVAAAAAAGASASGVSEVSRTLGRTLAELRRAREEVQRSFRVDLDPEPAARRTPRVTPSPEPPAEATSETPGRDPSGTEGGPTRPGAAGPDAELPS